MSLVSAGLASALSGVAAAKGESLQYSTTSGGASTALVGWVLHPARVPLPVEDGLEQVQMQDHDAYAKGPVGSPAFARGYELKDETTGDVYAVLGTKNDQQQIVTLKRKTATKAGPDRGGFG